MRFVELESSNDVGVDDLEDGTMMFKNLTNFAQPRFGWLRRLTFSSTRGIIEV